MSISNGAVSDQDCIDRKHDTILSYAKNKNYTFNGRYVVNPTAPMWLGDLKSLRKCTLAKSRSRAYRQGARRLVVFFCLGSFA